MSEPLIGPIPEQKMPVAVRPWNPKAPVAAARVIGLIVERLPGTEIEHIGSSSVPDCAGKGHLDLLIPYRNDVHLAAINDAIFALGFARQGGREPFPETRPMRHGTIAHEGETFIIHVHIVPAHSPEVAELRDFRDRLRADPALKDRYVAAKRAIIASGLVDGLDYTKAKGAFIAGLGFLGAENA